VLAVLGLLELDIPLTKFVRSLYHPVGYLPNPWLAYFSDIGDRLGRGESLVALSLLMLLVGAKLKRADVKLAGWQTLAAHGIVAVLSNLIKHVVGRPRPKFIHTGTVDLSPFGGSGWDSFPSGHATSAVAIAAVLAVRFPRGRWIFIGAAAAIAASRIIRGSHFLTDTVGGAALGWLMGTIAAHPWREWRSSLASALASLAPVCVGVSTAIWVMGHASPVRWPGLQLTVGGVLVTAAALVGYAWLTVSPIVTWSPPSKHAFRSLAGLGLAMAAGSAWIAAAALCACLAGWIRSRTVAPPVMDRGTAGVRAPEVLFFLLVLLGLWAILQMRGLLPLPYQ
jgi:undecaprenyl-diphosphatase